MIHHTATVHGSAYIGEGTQVWLHCQIRENAHIGAQCVLGKGVYIDHDVIVGNHVKIQNNVSIYYGVVIESGAFIGPHVCFTNDKVPRSITPDGRLLDETEWEVLPTHVGYGASIGANAVIRCGVSIGDWAMVGSGAVVTRDVPPRALVVGNPARVVGTVTEAGKITYLGSS